MFTDKIETVKFYAEEWVIDQIVDWFGYDFKIEKAADKYMITVRVSLNAMEYWAMQYLKAVEIVSPIELRERIRNNIDKAKEIG